MPDRPENPPPRYPVTELRTPNMTDGFFTELVNRSDSAYQARLPMKRGQPYASMLGANEKVIARYPQGLFFLKELRPGNSSASDFGNTSDWVIWVWATDELAEDTYNAEISYMEEGVAYPAFARVYTIRRKDYEAAPTIATGTALTGLMSVAITAAGANYTYATGTIATGATCEAVCFNGAIIDWIVTNEGTGVTSGGSIAITGDGSGATATARIQPVAAVLVAQKKEELPSDNPRSHDYVRVVRIYRTEPGPILTTSIRSEMFNGEIVYTIEQEGLTGTLPTESGAGVIESVVTPIDSVRDKRVTKKFSSAVTPPATQKWAFWEDVPLPQLVFDIEPIVFCNETPYFTVVLNEITAYNSSQWRKHRITLSYSFTAPDPDLSASSFEKANPRYQGKVIAFQFNNALLDHLTFSGDCYLASGGCFWTEEWDFPATTPSATTFYAGAWYIKSNTPKQLGPGLWMCTKIEYYSAPGNPSI